MARRWRRHGWRARCRARWQAVGDRDAVRRGIRRRLRHALLAEVAERLVRHLQLALVVDGVGFELGELALARRMVHQRGQLHPVVAVEIGEAPPGSRGAETSQRRWMKWSARSRSCAHAVLDRVGELAHVLDGEVGVLVHADAQGIEHGGDAGGRDLRVMGQHRGDRVPAHFRARRVVAFEMVGVEFDQARDDVVAPMSSPAASAACGRYRRSCRREAASEPVTTSSASTMRALVRTVSVGHFRQSFVPARRPSR